MEENYTLNYSERTGKVSSIQKDNMSIPLCEANTDYQDFLKWNKEQTVPLDLNSVYVPTKEEVKTKTNAEIYAKLDAIDKKSIRALRDGDTVYIENYRAEAEKLRSQIQR
jgi:hypothetical protein